MEKKGEEDVVMIDGRGLKAKKASWDGLCNSTFVLAKHSLQKPLLAFTMADRVSTDSLYHRLASGPLCRVRAPS